MNKILVVDDDQDLRENLVEVLSEAGFSLDSAGDGHEAIEQLATDDFNLVLLDSIMPGMGGMEVLPQIKRNYPKIKIIMLTAFSTVDGAVEAMRKGADDYIAKPFKIVDLLVAVRTVLEEAKFVACGELLNTDKMFKCLANATRRKSLLLLKQEGRLQFMDIVRRLKIDDHTKVNFHLKILKDAGLLEQDGKKQYQLSAKGEKIITCLTALSSS
ncbi:MAG: response regulator [Desulfuromusa sp.]|nr:response regulator [Desulfuromusa sp.]